MPARRHLLVHVLIDASASTANVEELKTALKSAVQVGLNSRVFGLEVYQVATQTLSGLQQQSADGALKAPPSDPSDKDQILEEYLHCEMQVQIYRDSGHAARPTYYATVSNPSAKYPTGALVEARSYAELRQVAEARAERKAAQWGKRLLAQKADGSLT